MRKNIIHTVLCILAFLAVVMLSDSAADTTVKHPAPKTNLAKAVPTGVCPLGHAAVWLDQSTAECFKEFP